MDVSSGFNLTSKAQSSETLRSGNEKVKTIDDLQCFLIKHIYAVWYFISLLKVLQNKLTCKTTPWLPIVYSEVRCLINEIVVAEETNLAMDGSRQSHFKMYLDVMQQ